MFAIAGKYHHYPATVEAVRSSGKQYTVRTPAVPPFFLSWTPLIHPSSLHSIPRASSLFFLMFARLLTFLACCIDGWCADPVAAPGRIRPHRHCLRRRCAPDARQTAPAGYAALVLSLRREGGRPCAPTDRVVSSPTPKTHAVTRTHERAHDADGPYHKNTVLYNNIL